MKKNDTVRLYEYIYKNAQMGVGTTAKLLHKTKDPKMCEHLREEHKAYSAILLSADTQLRQAGREPKGLSSGAKARTSMMISFETSRSDASSHIAEMLMTGNNMGIIGGVKAKKKCPEAAPQATALLHRLVQCEEGHYQALKEFL